MYCLIQFYVQLKEDLAEHRPLLKVAAIKLVIFLSFWQTLLISLLTSSGAIKPSARFQTPDIKIGIPAMLLCIEMAIFAGFHLIAFPWQVYDIRRSAIVASESAPGFLPDPNTAYLGGPFGVKAFLDAYNPWDLIKAVGRGFRWVTVGRRKREQDVSYKPRISRPLAPEHHGGQSGTFASTIGNGSAFSTGKSGRYQPVRAEDEDRLLANPQAVPLSASANTFPRPGMRLPDDAQQEGDIGASGLYDAPEQFQRAQPSQPHHVPPAGTHPPQHSYRDNQDTGIVDLPFEDRDTSYHGPGASLTPIPPPAASHLYAHHNHSQAGYQLDGTESADSAGEWDDWSGAHGPHNQSDVALGSIAHESPPRDHRARGPSPSEMWSEMQGYGVHRQGERD
ncbi:MAG: hypothetical protein LQ351_002189 [Letrouitia transgressa]|nr:MAG: hypothetical protein LQ351_002189 [Letrouitia transgressa]